METTKSKIDLEPYRLTMKIEGEDYKKCYKKMRMFNSELQKS